MPDEETDVTFGDLDFDAIETAVMETARGRWFLKEYARRNRHADTQTILEAVERLKEPVVDEKAVARLRSDLEEMAVAIRQTREAIRSFPMIDGNDPSSAPSEAELQAAAEQRIRHMVLTFQYLERHVRAMIALCDAKAGQAENASEPSPFEGEKARHLHPHPAFLM
ncbi:hypothetical protein [Microvirga zambiensis]|uniref:hypothetical protein n=1 Tax=Microvirga zambiensis TaxID=1402137 RepID=UPI00191E2DD6